MLQLESTAQVAAVAAGHVQPDSGYSNTPPRLLIAIKALRNKEAAARFHIDGRNEPTMLDATQITRALN